MDPSASATTQHQRGVHTTPRRLTTTHGYFTCLEDYTGGEYSSIELDRGPEQLPPGASSSPRPAQPERRPSSLGRRHLRKTRHRHKAVTVSTASSVHHDSPTPSSLAFEAAEWLDVPAVTPGTMLYQARLFNFRTNVYDRVRVLADSGSQVNMACSQYYKTEGPCKPVNIQGLHGAKPHSEVGVSILRLGTGSVTLGATTGVNDRMLKVHTHLAGQLSNGRVQLILSAATSVQLGLLNGQLESSHSPLRTLPPLVAAVDHHPLRTVPLWNLRHAVNAQPSVATGAAVLRASAPSAGDWTDHGTDFTRSPLLQREFESRLHGDYDKASFDEQWQPYVLEQTNTAHVAISDAIMGHILERCDGDPFPDKTYSLDDITIGVNVSQAAADASGIKGLRTGGVLTLDQARQMRVLLERHRTVFAMKKIPAVNKAPPVKVRLKPDPPDLRYPLRPSYTPPPTFTPNVRIYLDRLRTHWLSGGVIVPNPHGQWATRIHVTGKGPKDHHGEVRAARPTEDDRGLNARVHKNNFLMPNGVDELRRAAIPSFCSVSTDANSAFTAFAVDEESQGYFTFWLPLGPKPTDGAGKFKSTRMPFGYTNAPSHMMEYFHQAISHMSTRTRELLSCFYDDFFLRSPQLDDDSRSFAQLLEDFDDFLTVCAAFGIELSPPKTFIGMLNKKFYGFKIQPGGGSTLSDANLATIRDLPYPTNPSEVRSVIGFLTQSRQWAKGFSEDVAPISALAKKGAAWVWGKNQIDAFERVRRKLLSATANYSPDFRYPIKTECDASDNAIGSRIFQTINGTEYNIGFYSRTLTAAEKLLPVYFRECIALLEAIKRAKIFALSSPFSLQCYTDQHSLVYTSTVSKGPLSAYLLASVADVDYTITWIAGVRNKIADFLSRYGTEGPRRMTSAGLAAAVDLLLERLGDDHRSDDNIWLYAQKDTAAIGRRLQRWRHKTNALKTGAPIADKLDTVWDFCVINTTAVKSPGVCANLLKSRRPFAILIPLDLLSVVALRHDGSFDRQVFRLLENSSKIAIPMSNQIWIVTGSTFDDAIVLPVEAHFDVAPPADCFYISNHVGAPSCDAPTVHAANAATRYARRLKVAELRAELETHDADTTGLKATLVDRLAALLGDSFQDTAADDAREQERRRAEELTRQDLLFYDQPEYGNSSPGETKYVIEQLLEKIGPVSAWVSLQQPSDCEERLRLVRASDAMMMCSPGKNQPPLIVVPTAKRAQLMRLVHLELGHNVSSMLSEIRRAFYWKGMRAQIKAFCASCRECLLNKTRVSKLHQLWRGRAFTQPRAYYSMDIKKISSDDPIHVSYALCIIDRFSSYAIVARLPNKTTDTVISALMTHVLWKFGAIVELTIDSEKGFTSERFNAWARRHGINVVKPLAYSPTGNGSAEIFWKHYETALRSSSNFPGGPEEDAKIAFAWNTQTKATTGFTPFAIQHGSAATTAAVNLARGLRAQRNPSQDEHRQLSRDLQRAAAAITAIAAARGNTQRRVTAISLNRRSRSQLVALEVGDKAFVYQPASGAVVNARGGGRNRAFVGSFTGPATVTARRSNTAYVLTDDKTGATYDRHRKHLRPLHPLPRALSAGDDEVELPLPPPPR